ncbi:MAG: hypothetical protein AAB434_09080, partial [Planctomycetota bacterium]
RTGVVRRKEDPMRRWLLAAMAATAMGTAVFAEDAVNWAASYDEALKAAKESGKLLMIDFFTEW